MRADAILVRRQRLPGDAKEGWATALSGSSCGVSHDTRERSPLTVGIDGSNVYQNDRYSISSYQVILISVVLQFKLCYNQIL